MGWSVELSGGRSDLARLAKSAALPAEFGWTVATKEDAYYVTSPEFDALNDAELIRSRASEILALWNGAARLHYDGGNIGIKYTRFVSPGGRQSVTRGFTFHVRKADSVEASDAAEQCVRHATEDSVLRRVLELASNGLSDWVNLYRIYEVIDKDCGGMNAIVSRGWATKAAMRLFKHTANNPAALGVDARHGASDDAPPPKPMSLPEASTAIRGLVQSWLKAKAGAPGK